jgi:hypothetical protein
MAALHAPPPLNHLAVRDPIQPLQVVCAWPMSGQYGPGTRVLYVSFFFRFLCPFFFFFFFFFWLSRMLLHGSIGKLTTIYRYYVLVAACLFARKAEWLRNACLAAAMLFPAVAAVHGIVLPAVHANGQFSLNTHERVRKTNRFHSQVQLIWISMAPFNSAQ